MLCRRFLARQVNAITKIRNCLSVRGANTTGKAEPVAISAKFTMSCTETPDLTDPVEVCKITDIADNQMKEVNFDDDTKVLLVRQKGQLRAIGAKCSHYGAPLSTGVLGEGRVRCPWHGACFNLETGDIEDFPGLDSVPCYKVEVNSAGSVLLRGKRAELGNAKRIKQMARRSPANPSTYIVVGGGPSGAVCAETLRQQGYDGRLIFVCREPWLPYDRIKISKTMNIELPKIQFRDAAFYAQNDIELKSGVEARQLNVANKTLSCSDGETYAYDKLYIATGSSAVKPRIPGADCGNVYTIREYSDAVAVHEQLTPASQVVCLGASFIALEAAAYLVDKVAKVTLIGRENVPLKASFGELIGERVLRLFRDNGVHMQMNSGIAEIVANEKHQVASVVLTNGERLNCDLLIMGTGARANTAFLSSSGLQLNENGSIDVSDSLETNVSGVYAGGDIANANIIAAGGLRATIGHYQLAQYHGRIAACNMTASPTDVQPLAAVPFFFTMFFGKGIRYAGYGHYDDVIIDGDLAELKFVAYYVNAQDDVVAVASCGRDPIVAQYAELLTQRKSLKRAHISDPDSRNNWTKMINKSNL